MAKDIFKMVPKSAIELVRRVEKLEMLARMNGDLFLFLVEKKNETYLVTGSSVESVIMRFPGANVDFLGRASSMYTEPKTIRSWQGYNY